MMKKFFVGLFSLLMGVGSAFAQTNMSSEMYDLAKMKEGLRNRRVSSYDRTGNNRDHLKAIKPAKRLSWPTQNNQPYLRCLAPAFP